MMFVNKDSTFSNLASSRSTSLAELALIIFCNGSLVHQEHYLEQYTKQRC